MSDEKSIRLGLSYKTGAGAFNAQFEAFCEAEGYSGDVFKTNLWKLWCASRSDIRVKLPGIYADCYCPSTAQSYKEDCASILRAIGLTVEE